MFAHGSKQRGAGCGLVWRSNGLDYHAPRLPRVGNWEVGKALLSLLTLSLLRGPRYACKCQVGLPQANDTTAAVLFALVVIVSRSLATFTDVYPSSAHHTKAQPHRPFGWLAGRLSSLGRFVERSAEARSACLCMVQLSLRHWRDW